MHDVLSINNPNFTNWIRLIYPKEFEIKEITETAYSALLLESEIRISKFEVICSPWVSNTIQPNKNTSDWQVNISERPAGALLIPCFSIQRSQSRVTQNIKTSPEQLD